MMYFRGVSLRTVTVRRQTGMSSNASAVCDRTCRQALSAVTELHISEMMSKVVSNHQYTKKIADECRWSGNITWTTRENALAKGSVKPVTAILGFWKSMYPVTNANADSAHNSRLLTRLGTSNVDTNVSSRCACRMLSKLPLRSNHDVHTTSGEHNASMPHHDFQNKRGVHPDSPKKNHMVK